MGPARSIKTKDWNYIALRYTAEQAASIREQHRSVKQLMGLSGGVSRARKYPHAFHPDQLYDLKNAPEELVNVAADTENKKRIREMKRILKKELTRFENRPFGEFVPGGNAVSAEDQQDLAPLLRKFSDNMK